MPIHKAWMFTCARCGITDTFYSSDRMLEKHQAEADAREIGWQEIYGDWHCRDCVPTVKREHRAEARRKTEVSA